jgi:ATP-dependent Lon protease
MVTHLMQSDDPATLAYLVAAMLNVGTEQAVSWLEIGHLPHLLHRVHEHLAKEVQILELRQKIAGEAKDELDKKQRDYILREQLNQIKKELGETDDQDETALLRQRLEEAELPDDIRTELERELGRLQRLAPAAPDYQVLRSYLEFA